MKVPKLVVSPRTIRTFVSLFFGNSTLTNELCTPYYFERSIYTSKLKLSAQLVPEFTYREHKGLIFLKIEPKICRLALHTESVMPVRDRDLVMLAANTRRLRAGVRGILRLTSHPRIPSSSPAEPIIASLPCSFISVSTPIFTTSPASTSTNDNRILTMRDNLLPQIPSAGSTSRNHLSPDMKGGIFVRSVSGGPVLVLTARLSIKRG
ncbi:hypothetical protein FHL15_003066 [Xylaria flabelliformis]|uniref:Uncharacterized protein n=1 Tax=Xylaria flabelliformis TaxID=2512241 RepID=A0A553I6X8_9PEZI|nr:hypothetical protein FHL15_003066 [Xylaria flabelliformis]